jgi:hypothetical protein
VFNDLDRSRDATCRGSPLPTAGDEVPLCLGSNQTSFNVLDAPVQMPLVFGGCSGSMDFSNTGFLSYSPKKTLGALLAFGYHIPAP